ncbi:hypothetical protein NQ317_003124 [Molorchus minor]|uniref:Uncharacterized protein n=1 Tax=Molorchus minor TaxID=1323400 RepID=A0ABQ9JLF4_9CUCU|nr:hypothetical protein NQ317_003124 [Molorchus minor]
MQVALMQSTKKLRKSEPGYQKDVNTFKSNAQELVKLSREHLYDEPPTEDKHYITFERYVPEIHNKVRTSMMTFHEEQISKVGHSWVLPGSYKSLTRPSTPPSEKRIMTGIFISVVRASFDLTNPIEPTLSGAVWYTLPVSGNIQIFRAQILVLVNLQHDYKLGIYISIVVQIVTPHIMELLIYLKIGIINLKNAKTKAILIRIHNIVVLKFNLQKTSAQGKRSCATNTTDNKLYEIYHSGIHNG